MGSYPATPEPEILPPGQQAEVRKPRPSWMVAPATYVLIGINCAIFLAMVARGVSATSPTPEQLIPWGANNAGAVLIFGEWQRIVSAMFIHVGILHLATNMWCLWNLGLLAEPLLGSAGLVAVYILTGAAGNLLATFVNWWGSNQDWAIYRDIYVFPTGAGASGAVFGIAGVLIVLLKSRRLPVPASELKSLRKSVIYFAALNLVIGFSINFGSRFIGPKLLIDNMAHLGGFGGGLLLAMPMVPKLGSPKELFRTRRYLAIGMMTAILVLFGVYIASFAGQPSPFPH